MKQNVSPVVVVIAVVAVAAVIAFFYFRGASGRGTSKEVEDAIQAGVVGSPSAKGGPPLGVMPKPGPTGTAPGTAPVSGTPSGAGPR